MAQLTQKLKKRLFKLANGLWTKRSDLPDFQQLRKEMIRKNNINWIGLAIKAPLNPNPQFKSDDDLWK